MRTMLAPLILTAVSAARLSVMPIVSYSSSTGFLYGGRIDALTGGRPRGALSLMAYGTTRGGQYQSVDLMTLEEAGGWRLYGVHDQLLGADFYGWGNGGDPDTSAGYDREIDRVGAGRVQQFGDALTLEIGLEARHSTAWDREESALWETAPALRTASSWSIGPDAALSAGLPLGGVVGYDRIGYAYQSGDGFDYHEIRNDLAVFVDMPSGFVIGTHGMIRHHMGVEETPLPFLPSLGPEDLLRGYANERFRGAWAMVANLELQRPLLTFMIDRRTLEPTMLLGAAVYVDAGQVAEEPAGFRWDRLHPDAGIGLRFVFGLTKVRMDFTILSPEGFTMDLAFGDPF